MEHLFATSLIIATASLSIYLNKLSFSGGITGTIVALCIWMGAGWAGLLALLIFFVSGTVASRWQLQKKQELTLEQEGRGRRTISHVLANGGIAAICGILAYHYDAHAVVFQLMLYSSIAVAMSDTLSSELGNVYGSKYINICTFKSDKRGLDGVISIEGSVFGILGSGMIGLTALAISNQSFLLVTVIGFLGNLTDSILGATLQRRGLLNNHHVNFLATLTGAVLAWLIF